MKINKAVKKAVKNNGYISRKLNGRNTVFIKPTDGNECCVVYLSKEHSQKKWNPCAKDFLRKDWEVFTEEEFAILSKKNKPFLA